MIEFQNISKAYKLGSGKKILLENISFCFEQGVNIGILGSNGAGKSTLLRLIAGSEAPNKGRILRSGTFSWPLGFAAGFQGSLSGEENLRFICRIYAANIGEVTRFVADFSELGDALYEPVFTYSTGMRARLAFALSMAIQFDVYLVDEIMGVGDRLFQEKCHHAFVEKSKGSSIIMVSHNMDTIREYSDVVLLLSNGRVRIYEDIEKAIATYEK
ncbi:MAG TPA: ABC transporter ATP-binding protein [Leucothrix mucor]|uniref:ABC transporter ATP-binding protein n=1 Tax=Leucothrix mucor TaxID=45248 RepID=A0A7V2WU91_LEUMU|nr:ABC transporter ATP-binding protein [Leucothrix mucor]